MLHASISERSRSWSRRSVSSAWNSAASRTAAKAWARWYMASASSTASCSVTMCR